MRKTHEVKLTPRKTYATEENMIVAIEKAINKYCVHSDYGIVGYRYLTLKDDGGRLYPVFVMNGQGNELFHLAASGGFCVCR